MRHGTRADPYPDVAGYDDLQEGMLDVIGEPTNVAKGKVPSAEQGGFVPKKREKQEDLPGMEDRLIKDLENATYDYVGIRDQRMELSKSESELKSKLLGLMKKHGKETYIHDGLEIAIVHEEETVKVKIKHEKEAEVEAAAEG